MIIPQFSIRSLLYLMTASGAVFLVVGLGVRGRMWAAGVTAALIMGAAVLVVQALAFWLLWACSNYFFKKRPNKALSSPSVAPTATEIEGAAH